MTKRIIYQTNDGNVAVIVPAPDAVVQYGIDNIALKDVPFGKPYKIIDTNDVPADRTFRAAWEIDLNLLDSGVGADYGVGSANKVIGWNEDGTPIVKVSE